MSGDLNELTAVERQILLQLYGRDLERFVSSVMPETQTRKTVKSVGKTSNAEMSVDGKLFEN